MVFYIVSPKFLSLAWTNKCFRLDLQVCFLQPAPRFFSMRRFCYKLTMQLFFLPTIEFLVVPRCLEIIFAHSSLLITLVAPTPCSRTSREFFTYQPKVFPHFSHIAHSLSVPDLHSPVTHAPYQNRSLDEKHDSLSCLSNHSIQCF